MTITKVQIKTSNMNIKYQVFCVYLECEDGDNHLAECSYFHNSDVYSKGI